MILNNAQIQDIVNGIIPDLSNISESYREGLLNGIELGQRDIEQNSSVLESYRSTISHNLTSSISLPEARPNPLVPLPEARPNPLVPLPEARPNPLLPTVNPVIMEVATQLDAIISGLMGGLGNSLPWQGKVASEISGLIQGFLLSTIASGPGSTPDWEGISASTLASAVAGVLLPYAVGLAIPAILGVTAAPVIATIILSYIGSYLGAVYGDAIWDGIKAFLDPIIDFFDPLVIDLDGDGIELTSLENSSTQFDLSGNGFAELTGWTTGDDAFLARDLNGNGTIDDISELFGNVEIDGFTELALLDSNGDGVIDAQDAAFAELVLWQDANSNGITDEGELISLLEAGITSINLEATATNGENEGNEVTFESSVTFANGSTATIQDIGFQTDQLSTRFIPPEDLVIADGAFILPNLKGYGVVADTYYAYSMDADLMAAAENLVALASAGNISDFREAFEEFVLQWAGVEDVTADSRGHFMDARHISFIESLYGRSYTTGVADSEDPQPLAAHALENFFEDIVDSMALRFLSQVTAAEALSSGDFGNIENNPLFNMSQVLSYNLLTDSFSSQDEDNLAENFETILDLYVRSHQGGNPPLDIENTLSLLQTLRLDYQNVDGGFNEAIHQAFLDAGFTESETDGYVSAITNHIGQTVIGTTGDDILSSHSSAGDLLQGGNGDDTYIWRAGDGNDIIDEIGRSDDIDTLILEGVNSADVMVFLNNDRWEDVIIRYLPTGETITLNNQMSDPRQIESIEFADGVTWSHNALMNNITFLGQDGDDIIYGRNDNDILDGRGGNDHLEGRYGDDTYIFREGSGHDFVNEEIYGRDVDTLKLEGLNVEDVTFARFWGDNYDLVVTINSTGETITFNAQFDNEGGIERIEFADGTVWGEGDTSLDNYLLSNVAITGTEGDETIYGHRTHDDILDGRGGNDHLEGQYGDDTYIFREGSGHDFVNEERYGRDVDTLRLEGLNVEDVTFTRLWNDNYDLVVTINSTGETITLNTQFDREGGVERIEFADGTVWSDGETSLDSQLRAIAAITGTDGAEAIYGHRTLGDILDGGAGNDHLEGQYGNDTYIFREGSGHDFVNEERYGRDVDTLRLEGLNVEDVTFTRLWNDNYDLVVTINSTGETITLNTQFDREGGVERIEFADGTVWSDGETSLDSQLRAIAAITGTDGAEAIYGHRTYNDIIDGGAGDDYLAGRYGNDTYIFREGSGDDFVNEERYGRDVDTLRLEGLNVGDVTFARLWNDHDDLVVTINSTGERITFNEQLDREGGVERIEFADGTIWGDGDVSLDEIIIAIAGFTGSDSDDILFSSTTSGFANNGIIAGLSESNPDDLVGFAGNNNNNNSDDFFGLSASRSLLHGRGGDDQLFGNVGHDRLNGGTGNDLLFGGEGDDSFIFSNNFGLDIITDFSQDDDDIDFSNNTVINSLDDLTITYEGENALITTADGTITLENIDLISDNVFSF